jgi:hypothetical protein
MNKHTLKCFVALYETLLVLRAPLVDFLLSILPPVFQEDWWEIAVVRSFNPRGADSSAQRDEKFRKQRILKTGSAGDFSCLDFLDLIEIIKYNWNDLAKDDGRLFNPRFFGLLSKLRIIRNDVSHPTASNLDKDDFKKYMAYLHEFSLIISSDIKISDKLAKYNYQPEEESIHPSLDKKRQLIDLIEKEVLDPALNCPTLKEDIKDSITRTIIKFEITNSIEEVDRFFRGSLASPRGEIVHKELEKNKLKSFEDIRGKYRQIFEL